MYFPAAESLSCFLESALKRLPTATEAEVKQVISAQLKYAPDRAHGGGRGKDGRRIERSGNGSGTLNPQLREIMREFFTVFTLDCQTKQQIIFRGTFFLLFTYDLRRENENKLSFIFVICCFSTNTCALSREKKLKIATPDLKKYTPLFVENKIVGCVSFSLF